VDRRAAGQDVKSAPATAFGGYKQSGWAREFGQESIEAYTQTKSIMVRM
jgi:acyl-CoA reductase-like NAD-dependent aldehyde dehydrogenase